MARFMPAVIAAGTFMLAASEVVLAAGAELGGLLPTKIQNYTVFAGAIVATAKQPAAGKALLDFLAAPDTIKIMRAKGLEPAS
jgi:molybdate transport system substrate-binding protein